MARFGLLTRPPGRRYSPVMTLLIGRRLALAGACVLGFLLPQIQSAPASASADATLSGTAYTPRDYPIQPMPFTEVKIKDTFWAPKIKTNAEVSIPFEIQKSGETAGSFDHNILQAAIYSLQTHPDSRLQTQVDARIQAIQKAEGARQNGHNSFFEVAAAHYAATGKRDLLDIAIKSADSIYNTYKSAAPPFRAAKEMPSTVFSCTGLPMRSDISTWPSTISTSAAFRIR
jgi:hypothetical protein